MCLHTPTGTTTKPADHPPRPPHTTPRHPPPVTDIPTAAQHALNQTNHHNDPHRDRTIARLQQMVANGTDEIFIVQAAQIYGGNGHLIADDGGIPTTQPAAAFLDPHTDQPQLEPLPQHNRPTFPTHILPNWIANYTTAIAHDLQCPPDLPNTVALGVLSLIANRNQVTITTPAQWTEGTNLYLACALPPGGAKSPVFARLMKPLEQYQNELDTAHKEADALWRAQHHRLEQTEKQTRNDATKPGAGATERGLHDDAYLALDTHTHTQPHRQRLSVADTTPEAIIDPLAAANGRLAVMSPEGTLFGAMSRYTERGADPNIDIYLAGYSGDRYTVDRRSRTEPIDIPEVRMTICVLTQPEPLYRILTDDTNKARGFSDRFMVSEPATTIGHRRYHNHPTTTTPETTTTYETLIAAYIQATSDHPQLHLTTEAWNEYNRWRDRIEQHRLGRWAPLAGMPEKTHQAVLRTAAILHLANGHELEPVDIVTIIDACQLGDYWLETALAIARTGEQDRLDKAAKAVHNWTQTEHRQTFTLRELGKAGVIRSHGYETNEQMAQVLQRLEQAGHVQLPAEDGREWWRSSRGTASPTIHVYAQNEHNEQ